MENNTLLDNLILLRNGLVNNGENNKHVDRLNQWINNINDKNTIQDIISNLHYKLDSLGAYYIDSGPMFDYLYKYFVSECHNKNLQAFFQEKDAKTQLEEIFHDIKEKALYALEIIEQKPEEFNFLKNELAKTLKFYFDRMMLYDQIDRPMAADICRMSLHTDNIEVLKEIAAFFDIDLNKETLTYILGFSDLLIVKKHWGNLISVMETIYSQATAIASESK